MSSSSFENNFLVSLEVDQQPISLNTGVWTKFGRLLRSASQLCERDGGEVNSQVLFSSRHPFHIAEEPQARNA